MENAVPPPKELELEWLEGGHGLGAASAFG